MNKALIDWCAYGLGKKKKTDEEIQKNIQWYKDNFGICCDCTNFMPDEYDCVESIINDKEPLQNCCMFNEEEE